MANSTADGSVVIDVDMNVSQAEKRLGKLRGDIKKQNGCRRKNTAPFGAVWELLSFPRSN